MVLGLYNDIHHSWVFALVAVVMLLALLSRFAQQSSWMNMIADEEILDLGLAPNKGSSFSLRGLRRRLL